MEIIKKPVKKEVADPLYEVECTMGSSGFGELGCGAVFRFRKSEMTHISDQRDGDADYIKCPCCGKTIWRNNFNFKRIKEEELKLTEKHAQEVYVEADPGEYIDTILVRLKEVAKLINGGMYRDNIAYTIFNDRVITSSMTAEEAHAKLG